MSVGRNELCPCGSGKKYKKCCGIVTPITQLQGSREQKLRQEYMQWIERFNRFISAQLTQKEITQARKHFADLIGLPVEECEKQLWDVHFLNWFVFDADRGKTSLIQDFLRQYGRKMERSMQQAFAELSLGIYEIVQVEQDSFKANDLVTGTQRTIVGGHIQEVRSGQIVIGRLLPMGLRDLLFSGSLILQSGCKQPLLEWIRQMGSQDSAAVKEILRNRTPDLYRFILEIGSKQNTIAKTQDHLVRRVYAGEQAADVSKTLEQHPAFELKKRDLKEEIWVYSARKEEFLFRALNNALLELHEVLGEVLLTQGQIWLEGFEDQIAEMEEALQLSNPRQIEEIGKLTSTGSKLTRGTIFITSQPTLPKKVLHWAVQTYFAEKWLVSPHPELNQLPPVLAAASNQPGLREQVNHLVNKMEDEAELGVGAARFMRVEMLRSRLALPSQAVHIQKLLNRPLVQGMPDSSYTVQPERLNDIARFVAEMTEGKSEATVKKYDEAMNLFRSFVRNAFGPEFNWSSLRKEEVAYFLVHDAVERADALTKTLAANLLSVLAAFFKWLDKQYKTNVSGTIQPLLTDIKEELPEAYKLYSLLQREASQNLQERAIAPQEVEEAHLILVEKESHGWLARTAEGRTISLTFGEEFASALATDWMIAGLIGQTENGEWRLYGAPEVYPPAVCTLLGVPLSVLV